MFNKLLFILTSIAIGACQLQTAPASSIPLYFKTSFKQPEIPLISAEFGANFMLNINNNISSEIQSGYLYFSISQNKIRVDSAYEGALEGTVYDFSNVTDGDTLGTRITYDGSLTAPTCTNLTGTPFIVIFNSTLLQKNNAIYAGPRHDFLYGTVASWDILVSDAKIPVKVYLDANNTFVGYDFSLPGDSGFRTFGTLRFFNIVTGTINVTTFDITCP